MEYDRKDLKIQALLEKVSELTTNYENKIADLRVEITLKDQDLQTAHSQIEAIASMRETEAPVVSETSEDDSTN